VKDLADTIRDHWKRFGLIDLEIRESLECVQVIAKYRDKVGGPWGVGCDPDPIVAIEKALVAGEDVQTEFPNRLGAVREWTPELASLKNQLEVDFDNLL
jgi:ribosomal protein S12 methylthiotransferase accessory factor YcaO